MEKYLFCETIRKATKINPKLCPLFKCLCAEHCLLQSNMLDLQILRTHRKNLLQLIFRRTLFSPLPLCVLRYGPWKKLIFTVKHFPSSSSQFIKPTFNRGLESRWFLSLKQDKNRPKQSSKNPTVLICSCLLRGPGFLLPLTWPWAAGRGVKQGDSADWAWGGLYNALSSVVLELH